jgi:hypothetical protein
MNKDRVLAGARTVRIIRPLIQFAISLGVTALQFRLQVHVRIVLSPEDNASMNKSLPPVLVRIMATVAMLASPRLGSHTTIHTSLIQS